METLNKSLGKVSLGVLPKSSIFTFVPMVQKLPIQRVIGETAGDLTAPTHKDFTVSHEEATRKTMSDGDILKTEIIFIKDSVEGGAGNTSQPETKLQLKPPLHHVTPCPVSGLSENTPVHPVAAGTASVETDKHGGIFQQQCHDAGGAEVSSGLFGNRSSGSEDRSSPVHPAGLFSTPASSRESIHSDCKSWSAMQLSTAASPLSFSHTLSPCSSVLSGIFSPAVVRVKRHTLAPGSSLLHIPETCFSSCESLSSPLCPQPSPPRHRPPLTGLSLLTAILRKGRLPILSPTLQRPYTPCWPVNPVTLSFCKACSAASSVASIPLEISSRFSSSASIDGQNQSHFHNASLHVQLTKLSGSGSETAEKISSEIPYVSGGRRDIPPLPQSPSNVDKSITLPRAPLSLLCSAASNLKTAAPARHRELPDSATSKKEQHSTTSASKLLSAELEGSGTQRHLKELAYDNRYEQEASLPKESIHQTNPSLYKLQLLSQKMRSLPSCPPTSCSPAVTPFSAHTVTTPPPSCQNTAERCESKKIRPDSACIRTPQHFHRLTPSSYTHVVFPGWPSPGNSPSPDCFTPTPSPAPPVRDLTLSPSLSLRSTPSPRPGSGISDCGDREGKKRKTHKNRLNYKSLAAIPTNTLLLDQQEIDKQVERQKSPCTALDGCTPETHAEMCSPAQLRQQSEELYAAIDEILGDCFPESKTQSPQTSRASSANSSVQQKTSFPRKLGRETKYASLSSLHSSAFGERKTKPGVIRPMTAIPRLTVEDEESYLNPFRQHINKQNVTDKKVENLVEAGRDFSLKSNTRALQDKSPERRTMFSGSDLQITESGDQLTPPGKNGSQQVVSTSASHTER
ncbi:muscular LMNA-interacting protein isoform X2 [Thalassophryne amazonica]|uniref:muscular LMNA-interacting protein isoform X2 n=1 Tax=Thalassophryne amazonica TaxID=390379 RepID=UPI0014710908|nr:muscular LMNA-interacting protein isoform X2 [Thalassophryne amazonica]